VSIVLTGVDGFTARRAPAQARLEEAKEGARAQETQSAPIRPGIRARQRPRPETRELVHSGAEGKSRKEAGDSEKEEEELPGCKSQHRRHGKLVLWRRERAGGVQGGRIPG